MKAPATYPDDIQCRGCPQQYAGGADSARRHGWKIGWTPQMPSWCPECGGSEKRARLKAIVDTLNAATEPLFD